MKRAYILTETFTTRTDKASYPNNLEENSNVVGVYLSIAEAKEALKARPSTSFPFEIFGDVDISGMMYQARTSENVFYGLYINSVEMPEAPTAEPLDTNFSMLRDLKECYTPAERGMVNSSEIKLIKSKLHIAEMNTLQLRNLRDMTVMMFSSSRNRDLSEAEDVIRMDRMSAITTVIDIAIYQ